MTLTGLGALLNLVSTHYFINTPRHDQNGDRREYQPSGGRSIFLSIEFIALTTSLIDLFPGKTRTLQLRITALVLTMSIDSHELLRKGEYE